MGTDELKLENDEIVLRPAKEAFFYMLSLCLVLYLLYFGLVGISARWVSQDYPLAASLKFMEGQKFFKWVQAAPKGYFYAALAFVAISGMFGLVYSIVKGRVLLRKTKYILRKDYILVKEKKGFSYTETRLKWKNVTHIRMVQSWLVYRVLKIGHIFIESAGSEKTEAPLLYLLDPDKVYRQLTDLIAKKGISFSSDTLLASRGAKPFWPTFIQFMGCLGTLFFVLQYTHRFRGTTFLYPAVALLVVFLLRYAFLAAKRFRLYQNLIMAQEGPISRTTIMIPIQNICAASFYQSFWDKLFGRGELRITCHGTSQGISIKPIAKFKKIKRIVNRLLKHPGEGARKKTRRSAQEEPAYPGKPIFMDKGKSFYLAQTTFLLAGVVLVALVVLFWFHHARGTVKTAGAIPLLALGAAESLLLVLGAARGMKSYWEWKGNRYFLSPRSIVHQHKFLSSDKTLKFANDKITCVELRRDSMDELFDTCTVSFGSIGYEENIVFKNIARLHVPEILKILRIEEEAPRFCMVPELSWGDFMKSHLYAHGMIFFLAILFLGKGAPWVGLPGSIFGALLVVASSPVWYWAAKYWHKNDRLDVFEEYLSWERRHPLFSRKTFAFYRWIKHVDIHHCPFSSQGALEFFVAGEWLSDEEGEMTTRSIRVDYLDDIHRAKRKVEDVLSKRTPEGAEVVGKENEGLLERMPFAWHGLMETSYAVLLMVSSLVLLHFFYPGWVERHLAWLTFAGAVFAIGLLLSKSLSTLYVLGSRKISQYEGFLYKTERAILLKDVDHVNLTRNFWDRIFHTASIEVETISSPKTELTVYHVPRYKEFYETLHRRYSQALSSGV